MAPSDANLLGLLVVDKPGLPHVETDKSPPWLPDDSKRLLTSHDVVQQVRRWSGQRRIGHTGTLDPMASGVLVLCLGSATRLVEYYQGHPKQYHAEIVLGSATDTYDATGNVTQTGPIPALTPRCIEETLRGYEGDIFQIPPIYSALKRQGESLHRKARRGETVEVQPREVTIYQLQLLQFHKPDRFSLRVVCSAGTYVRSLAHDLGMALGSFAFLAALRREAAGSFSLGHAHSLETIEHSAKHNHLADLLLPPGSGLEMPSISLGEESLRRLGHGQIIRLNDVPTDGERHLAVGSLAQAVDHTGSLAGIIRAVEPAQDESVPPSPLTSTPALWKAEKWFRV